MSRLTNDKIDEDFAKFFQIHSNMHYVVANKICLSALSSQSFTNAPVFGLAAGVPPCVLLYPTCQKHEEPERSSGVRLGSGRRSAVAQRVCVVACV